MNFETAIELAEMEGVEVESVVVDDDVAVEDSLYTSGRRGVCGTILVHKAAGAKAAQGADLSEVKRVAEKVVDNVGTMGTALTSCVTPRKASLPSIWATTRSNWGSGSTASPAPSARR